MTASRALSGREPLSLLRSKIAVAPRGVVVAFSGGRDSLALLAACAQLRDQGVLAGRSVRAIHVDHGLQRPSADWAKQCRRLARSLAVPLTVRRLEITLAQGQSLEAEARHHRYAVFTELIRRDECLLTAHHLEDQAETLLLQLLRGAGVRGLAAMPAEMPLGRGWLWRPWLDVPRAALESLLNSLASTKSLPWIEDPSNQDVRFDRNYLRAEVLPKLTARWPAAASVIARSAAHLGEARALLDELAAADLAHLRPANASPAVMELQSLMTLGIARQRNALRAWLSELGLSLPDTKHLERIRCELPRARADAQPIVRWPGGEVRRFGDRLYAIAKESVAKETATKKSSGKPAPLRWRWRVGEALSLGPGEGSLQLVRDAEGPLSAERLPALLWVRTRVGGESMALQGGAGRRRIKSLLREARVLPWWRERVPLLGAGEEVIAVGDLYVSARYRAQDDAPARTRLRLIWQRPEGWIEASG